MNQAKKEAYLARAKAALQKKALYGEDLDLKAYVTESQGASYPQGLAKVSPADRAQMLRAGVDLAEKERAGTFIQMDHTVVHCGVAQEGLEILSIEEALTRYDWLADYWWRAVEVDQDKYTAAAEVYRKNGYFIRALPGVKAIYPLQACLYLTRSRLAQNVHNVVIAEEGAELHIITGCTTATQVESGLHVGISEFYVKKGAKLTFTMIHNWAEDVAVRPRSGTVVEAGGLFVSNYVCLKPVRTLQMYPTTWLTGPGATARYYSILVAPPRSRLDVGSRAILRAPETRAEVIARSLALGGEIVNRGCLVGEAPGVKAHLECHGLVLGEESVIHAIPELLAKSPNVDLSHEAAVGKIAEEEIEYLMARGLTAEEATAAIVRGFLNVKILGLPPALQAEIDQAIAVGERALL